MEEHKCGKNLQRALGEMFVIDKEILKDEMDSFTISIKMKYLWKSYRFILRCI